MTTLHFIKQFKSVFGSIFHNKFCLFHNVALCCVYVQFQTICIYILKKETKLDCAISTAVKTIGLQRTFKIVGIDYLS